MTEPADQTTTKSGELTIKQGGIGFLIVAVILGAVTWANSHGILTRGPDVAVRWTWGGIPVEVFVGVFAVAGVVLTILGVVKKI